MASGYEYGIYVNGYAKTLVSSKNTNKTTKVTTTTKSYGTSTKLPGAIDNYSNASELLPTNEDLRNELQSHGVYNTDDANANRYSRFSRIPVMDPYNALTNAREYLFFTKPDLHLLKTSNGTVARSLQNFSFFNDVARRYKPVCEQLEYSLLNTSNSITNVKNPFMCLLSNTVNSGLSLPDLESDGDQESASNIHGTKISYRGTSYGSDQDLSFSLEFIDNKYLEVYMLFKIYDEYERVKNNGLIELDQSDSDDDRWINYTIHKVLHDQFSIYKIVVGEDGMTIIYYAKVTGVYPTGAPRSSFSEMGQSQDGQRIAVDFKGQFVKDMDPVILREFNKVASNFGYSSYEDLPLMNSDTGHFDGTFSAMPYIEMANPDAQATQAGKRMVYRLRWKKPKSSGW